MQATLIFEEKKTCPKCTHEKGVSEYGKRGNGNGNHRRAHEPQSWCRKCQSVNMRAIRDKNRGYRIPRPGEMPDGCSFCTNCKTFKPRGEFYNAAYRNGGVRPWCKLCDREARLLREYGITTVQWNQIFDSQGRACAICRCTKPKSKIGWTTDHDHTGAKEVRGILCNPCNAVLGYLRDNTDSVTAIPDYLQNPPARSVLQPSQGSVVPQTQPLSQTSEGVDWLM